MGRSNPAYIAMVRKAVLTIFLAGSPNETLDTPRVVLTAYLLLMLSMAARVNIA